MYGLPQVGIIAQELLAKRLKENGHFQSKTMPGLWTHEWRPIAFTLVVDNFGVKYVGEEHEEHLLKMVQKYYKCLFDTEGERYSRLTIKWDYDGKKVHLSMPEYIINALKRFQHPPPPVRQDQPHPHIAKTYGAKVQHANPIDDSPPPLIRRGRWEYFCFLQELSIQRCSHHSAPWRPSRRHLQNKQCKTAFSFWTMRHCKKRQSSLTGQAI